MNSYEKAIFEVCNVMGKYARQKNRIQETDDGEGHTPQEGSFNVYGFGGIPHYIGATNKVSRLWNLNGTDDPSC